MSLILYLHDSSRGLLRHVVDSILVSEPVGSLHRVVEMPSPVVLLHVPQSCIDSSLCNRLHLTKINVQP